MSKLRNCLILLLAFLGLNALAISAPSITCTRLSETSVRVSWTAVSGAVQYRVASQHGGGTWYYDTTTATTFTDTYATAQSCSYYVIAIDSSGASAQSSTATVSAYSSGGGSGGGSGSGSFAINASDGTSTDGVIITWSSQSGATSYRVVRGNTSTFESASQLTTVTGTSYTDTTAVAGKTYYYWIVAVKSSGNITSSANSGYRASSSGGSSGSGSGSGSGSSYNGQPYTVKFNANGGTGSMSNESFVYGTPKALTINTFTRTGYTFIGWAKSASATTPAYDDGESVSDLTTTSGGTVNLYAVWQANNYTIKFNKNGGTGSMANLAMTYGTAKALTANAFQRVNYKFIGWSTTASATTATYSNKQSVSNLTATPDGTVTLYAVWKLVLEVTSVTARQRYPWNGLVDIDVTFAASGLSTVSFTVKDTKGNTNLNARTFYVGNPEQNNRTLEVQPGTRRFVWDAFADLGQVTLTSFAVTAKVTEKNFQVNVTGGTGSGSFIQGKSVTIAASAKTGYTFASWTGTTADTGLLASATSASTTLTIPSRDVAYEATYTPNTYTVKFNANGGSGTMAYESFTYDVSKALTANAFTREDRLFLGWAESTNSTTVKYTDQQTVKNLLTSGTKNLYAVWSDECVQLWANGPYWAKCNVGTTYASGTGYFFEWADTTGYIRTGGTYDKWAVEDYGIYRWTDATWKTSGGVSVGGCGSPFVSNPTAGKTIEQLRSAGYLDSNGNLKAKYDAATAHWGSGWRMPTSAELNALTNKCTFAIETVNGTKGYRVTGKGAYASKSIFLPATGYAYQTYFYNYANTQTFAGYWSSTPYLDTTYYFSMNVKSGASGYGVGKSSREYYGYQIRPVRVANQ